MHGRFTVTAAAAAMVATTLLHAQTPATPRPSVMLTPFNLHAGARTIPAEEGLLFVPENRAKSGSRQIAVHFIRVRGSQAGRTFPPGSCVGTAGLMPSLFPDRPVASGR